jgi:hypothetical protein
MSELDPELVELLGVDEQLRASRPHANSGFRGELRRNLERSVERLDPDRDRILIAVYGACGAALLLAGALSAAGVGPLG